MDNELVFDNVNFEKAKAIARYNRFQNMMKMLQIFELVVAVVLISWSWTRIPVAVKFSGEVLVQVSAFLFKPHVVFLIGNGIIIAIVVLCRQTDAGSDDSVTDDINSEDILLTEFQQPIVTATCGGDVPILSCDSPLEPSPSVAMTEDKQVVSSELKVPEIQCNDVATAIDTATKQIQKFKRSQSEKLKREIATASSHRELRRSETDMQRLVVRPGDKKSSTVPVEAVDTLSNEEFRHTIEAFIKKNQIFFEKQRLAEAEKYERIGIKAF